MIDLIMRQYLERVQNALKVLSRQGRLDDALRYVERIEELADEDVSEPGRHGTLGRDEPLPALPLPRLEAPPENPFVQGEDTGVMTSAPRVPSARPSQSGMNVPKTCPLCKFMGELTRCPNDGEEMLTESELLQREIDQALKEEG